MDSDLFDPNTSTPLRNQLVFYSAFAVIGEFYCSRTHPNFHAPELQRTHHLVVFPRTSVEVLVFGRKQIVGSPNVAIFYNRGTIYQRGNLTDEDDRCDFFRFDQQLLYAILDIYDPAARDRDGTPFQFNHSFLNPQQFCAPTRLNDADRTKVNNPITD